MHVVYFVCIVLDFWAKLIYLFYTSIPKTIGNIYFIHFCLLLHKLGVISKSEQNVMGEGTPKITNII